MNLLLEDWITSSGSHPDRKSSPELTPEVRANAQLLLNKVNRFLFEIGYTNPVRLSSGFRTLEVNESTPGAAHHSGHESGEALDILDDDNQTLAKLVAANPDELRKWGLMMEDMDSTRGQHTNWCHIDMKPRADRPSRIFKP